MSYILFFDSGLGGLSVLREAVAMHPEENYLFVADGKNIPYGDKEKSQICAFVGEIIEKVSAKYSLRAIVIACNTATGAAISQLRSKYTDIPVIGIEPAIKPACTKHHGGRVGVMATSATLSGEKFNTLCRRYGSDAEIVPLPCPGLVELIESENKEGTERYLNELFYRNGSFDCLVLGCTHYPFIRSEIIKASLCNDVIDGARGTVNELFRQLGKKTENGGERIFINTDNSPDFEEKAKKFLDFSALC